MILAREIEELLKPRCLCLNGYSLQVYLGLIIVLKAATKPETLENRMHQSQFETGSYFIDLEVLHDRVDFGGFLPQNAKAEEILRSLLLG